MGPAHVVSIGRRSGGITPADFDGRDLPGMQRLLIHTWERDLPDGSWPEDFPFPTVELVDWLAARVSCCSAWTAHRLTDLTARTCRAIIGCSGMES
jgi:hypothetical protein